MTRNWQGRQSKEDAVSNPESSALRETGECLRLALEAARMGWWQWDFATGVFTGNERSKELLWRPIDSETHFDQVKELIHPDDCRKVEAAIAQAAATPGDYQSEFRVVGPDGSVRWLQAEGRSIAEKDGAPVRMLGVLMDITPRKEAEKARREASERLEDQVARRTAKLAASEERETAVEFLRLVNESKSTNDLVHAAAEFFQQKSGCEAVGIRLRREHDYPYYEARGFSNEFVRLENRLCSCDGEGRPICDRDRNPILECMCGNVICGRFDPSQPFFTAKGTFWTNSTSQLLATSTEADRKARTRNRCNGEGYESVALVALRMGEERLGLLQLNDKRKGRFTPEIIALWERLANYLAVALSKHATEETLREGEQRLRTLGDQIPGGAIYQHVRRPDGRVSYAYMSAGIEALLGLSADRVMADPDAFRELVVEEDRARLVAAEEQSARELTPFDCEFRQRTAAGEIKWVQCRSTPQRLEDGAILWDGVVMDITERKRVEEALRRSEQRLKRAQEIAHLGSWELDLTKNELTWSDEVYRIFGLAPQEFQATYEAFLERVHPDDRAAVDAAYSGSVREGKDAYEIDHRVVRKNTGEIRWVHEKCQHVRDSEGRIIRSAGMVLDVTERKRAEAELERAKAAAEAANEAKSAFLANISHELRTPMNAIIGMTDLALCEHLDPQVRDHLQTAKDSADVLLTLLNEILDFSRMESGQFTLDASPFPLRQTIEQTMKALSIRAYEKGLRLHHDIAPDVPDHLVGDSLRLRQILVNLVGNAIKFTDHGRVTVRVSVESNEAEEVTLQFAVTDTGIGIAPEDRERIFAPFAQADSSTTRRHSGTGLGLAIAKNLAHLMRGRLWVESQVGQGSTFSFTARFVLAADATPKSEGKPHSSDEPSFPARKLRILLAEDTRANQKLIVSILAKQGHAVEVASNGHAALDLLDKQEFDLVLMDVQMPVMDGLQATAAIRSIEQQGKRRIPIIAMTAHAMKGDRERCLAAGMDDYLAKPIDRRILLARIERLAGKGPSHAASSGDD